MNEMSEKFDPQSIPPTEIPESAYWFPFVGRKMLVNKNEDSFEIIRAKSLSELEIEPIHQLYLGNFEGIPCFAADLSVDFELKSDSLELKDLRSLYSSLDENIFWVAGRGYQLNTWDRNNQFCGVCGTPTKNKATERVKVCPNCNTHFYPRISPAIIVAINKGNQILLAHANRFPEKMYSILAGFVEVGETFEECVKREVREESSIEVKNIKYFGSQPWPFPDSLMVGFTAEYASGEIEVDGEELLHADWFSPDQMPEKLPGKISIARKLIDSFLEKYKSTIP